jgi:hypothetical protein
MTQLRIIPSFELGKCAGDLEEHAPGRRRGVDRLLVQDQCHGTIIQRSAVADRS